MKESQLQILILLVAGVSGGALWLLEGLMPFFQNRQGRLKHALPNLTVAALNTLLSSSLTVGALTILTYVQPYWQGLKGLGLNEMLVSVLLVLCYDFWMYIWHRLNHQIAFLWRFHRFHHADALMDVTTGVRFHPIEIMLSEIMRLPVCALLGIGAPEILLYNLLSFPIILLHHSNVALSHTLEKGLAYIIPTPALHRVHHSIKKEEADTNYGSMLSLWDRLFGSLRQPSTGHLLRLGIEES